MCGGGGKGLSQSSMTQSMANPWAMMQYANAVNQVNQATSAPFKRYSDKASDYIAPLTGTQTGAISNISGMAGMTDPYYQAAAALTGAGAQGVGRLTGQQIQEYMSPYMSQVIDPTRQALQQQFGQQAAQQQAQAIKAGAFGGERSGVERALLRGQQGLALGQALSPLYQTGYGQALQTAQAQQGVEQANLQRLLAAGQQAGGLGTAAQQAALQQAQAQLQAGTLEQQTATAGLQALYGEAQKERMYPLQAAAARAQGIAALAPLTGSQSTGYSLQPFFGGLAAAGGAIHGESRMGGAVTDAGDYADGGMAESPEFPSFDIRPSKPLEAELPRQQERKGLVSSLLGAGEAASGLYDKAKGLGSLAMKAAPFLGLAEGGRAEYRDGGAEDDGFGSAVERTLKFEGGLNPSDTNRTPSMYGINQAAHPGLDVTKLTPQQAKDIYRKEYWEGIGASKLPEGVREMAYDTAVMAGPGKARQLLAQSGGDPEKFMEARRGFLNSLVARDPEKYGKYAKAWENRNRALEGSSGSADDVVNRALAAIPKGDPRRGFMASAAQSAPVKESFTETITEHPERLAVPILQGLGAMAGSKSRYLGSAILEGLGAGAKSYMDTGTALEEQRKIHEEAGAQRAGATLAESEALGKLREMPIWVDPNTGLRLVMLADGRAVSMQEYLQNPRPVMGADQAAIVADQLGLQAAGKTQPGYAPEGGVMPTGVTAPQQAGLEPENVKEGTTVDLKPVSVPPATKQAPIIKPAEIKQTVGVTMGPAAKDAINEEMTLATSMGGHGAMEDSKKIKGTIDQAAMAARPQAIYNAQVAHIISEAANAKNWDAPGAASETRASIVNGLNTLARSFGLGDTVFGEMESRDQMLKKINAMRAEATVSGANQAALGSLETVLSALPSQGQSPRAGTFNAASNWVQNQRMIDRQNYANNYGLRSSGMYNRVDNAFSQDNPQSKYAAEEKAFQELMNHPAGPKIIDSFLHGRDLQGNPIRDPAVIDRFFEKTFKVPGMSRYFMGATGG